MTWQLGRIDGIVDGIDAKGQPMPVALPDRSGDLFDNGLATYGMGPQPLTFQPMTVRIGWPPFVHITLGFWGGVAAATAVLWLR